MSQSVVLRWRVRLKLGTDFVYYCDITAINEVIEVSKYVLKYNCRLHYIKYDINLMRSVEDQVLTLLVEISDEYDPITVYDNYDEALDHIKTC